MSPTARKEYYQHIKKLKTTDGLNVPVICSHASVGDAPDLQHFIDGKDKKKDENYFNTSSLSLNDEDIKVILDSDGMIGIVLHEGRIASKDAMKDSTYGIKDTRKDIEKAQKKIENFQKELKTPITQKRKERLLEKIDEKIKFIDECGDKIREGFANMTLANIYKIVEVYAKHNPAQKTKGWDHVGIGSDFDGMINKMDYLGTANEFPLLEKLLVRFLTNPKPLTEFDATWTTDRLKALQFNQSPSTLASKIMSQNADDFLRKYFNESYLKFDQNPVEKSGKNLIA
jgi:microsomal dipeptidase-like Zn-dependent dipeptidase